MRTALLALLGPLAAVTVSLAIWGIAGHWLGVRFVVCYTVGLSIVLVLLIGHWRGEPDGRP